RQILQGGYSVYLAGASPLLPPTTAAIAQSGQIPPGAKSISFYLAPASGLQVTFAGQPIPIFQIGTGANYGIWGGDVASLAGATGELLFSTFGSSSAILDN